MEAQRQAAARAQQEYNARRQQQMQDYINRLYTQSHQWLTADDLEGDE